MYLIVEDEPLALRDLEESLRLAAPGCIIAAFQSPQEALDYPELDQVDTAFLDVEMGHKNGLVLAKELKDSFPDMKIIFVTSHAQYALDAFALHATGYLLKPVSVEDIRRELTFLYGESVVKKKGETLAEVKTFGGFSIFVKGEPLFFGRAKAKELLALLVDRRGHGITTREACGILWEDKPYDRALKNYYHLVLLDLKTTLEQAGVERILIRKRNFLSIDSQLLDCDFYRFLAGDPACINSYHHDYMHCYSWAEFSVGLLENQSHG